MMRALLVAFALLASLPARAAISYVGGGSNWCLAATTCTVTYTTTVGNTVVVAVSWLRTTTSLTGVTDSGGSTYAFHSASQVETAASVTDQRLEMWAVLSGSASTTITATTAAATNIGIIVAEYSGVGSFGSICAINDDSTSATLITQSYTLQDADNYFVAGGWAASNSAFTAGPGTLRTTAANATGGTIGVGDNTAATATSVTMRFNNSAAKTAGAGVELRSVSTGTYVRFQMKDVSLSSNGSLCDNCSPASSTTATKWTQATTAVNNDSIQVYGSNQGSGTFGATLLPSAAPTASDGSCWRSENTYTGTFQKGAYGASIGLICDGATGCTNNSTVLERVRLNYRYWHTTQADCSSATEFNCGGSACGRRAIGGGTGGSGRENESTGFIAVLGSAPPVVDATAVTAEYVCWQIAMRVLSSSTGSDSTTDTVIRIDPRDSYLVMTALLPASSNANWGGMGFWGSLEIGARQPNWILRRHRPRWVIDLFDPRWLRRERCAV